MSLPHLIQNDAILDKQCIDFSTFKAYVLAEGAHVQYKIV